MTLPPNADYGARCPCCGERGLPHELSESYCPWCYDECTYEGCTRPAHLAPNDGERGMTDNNNVPCNDCVAEELCDAAGWCTEAWRWQDVLDAVDRVALALATPPNDGSGT